jgi:hypothetical protein
MTIFAKIIGKLKLALAPEKYFAKNCLKKLYAPDDLCYSFGSSGG